MTFVRRAQLQGQTRLFLPLAPVGKRAPGGEADAAGAPGGEAAGTSLIHHEEPGERELVHRVLGLKPPTPLVVAKMISEGKSQGGGEGEGEKEAKAVPKATVLEDMLYV